MTIFSASSSRYRVQEDRPFKAMRRVWEKKNLLDFFHVCPLVLHEKMGEGGGRPVYKFVFACPGRARALVRAPRQGGRSRASTHFFLSCICVLSACVPFLVVDVWSVSAVFHVGVGWFVLASGLWY